MAVGIYRRIFAVAILLLLLSLSALPTFHVSATTTQASTGVIVPLYMYPGSVWQSVIQAKQAYPSVLVVAVVKANISSGGSPDPNYVQGIQSLQSAGVTALGYVYTNYATRNISLVEADINTYKNWYKVNGMFFDEMSNVPGNESYYSTLSSYAKSIGLTFTVGNAGTPVPSSYIGTVDFIIIYENQGLPSLSSLSGWVSGYSKQNFAIVAYGVTSLNTTYVRAASNYVAYEYITDGNWPNPYATIASYFPSLVSALSPVVSVTIKSVGLDGSPISGLWATIQSLNGTVLASGFTPFTYTASWGNQYVVTVANYQNFVFEHWGNGSTSSRLVITPTQNTNLVAYYLTGPTVSLTVNSLNITGQPVTGYWTVIRSYNGTVVDTGYTSLVYNATSGLTYSVTVSDYGSYYFSHWSNGSTNRTITIMPTQATTLTAYYGTLVTINVKSMLLNGTSITGLWTMVESPSGTVLASGYTQFTFNAISGRTYVIAVADYGHYYFAQWSNGSTSRYITITPSQSTVLIAYYSYS